MSPSSRSRSCSSGSSEGESGDDEASRLAYRMGSAASLIAAADRLFELGYCRDAETRYSYAIGQYFCVLDAADY